MRKKHVRDNFYSHWTTHLHFSLTLQTFSLLGTERINHFELNIYKIAGQILKSLPFFCPSNTDIQLIQTHIFPLIWQSPTGLHNSILFYFWCVFHMPYESLLTNRMTLLLLFAESHCEFLWWCLYPLLSLLVSHSQNLVPSFVTAPSLASTPWLGFPVCTKLFLLQTWSMSRLWFLIDIQYPNPSFLFKMVFWSRFSQLVQISTSPLFYTSFFPDPYDYN